MIQFDSNNATNLHHLTAHSTTCWPTKWRSHCDHRYVTSLHAMYTPVVWRLAVMVAAACCRQRVLGRWFARSHHYHRVDPAAWRQRPQRNTPGCQRLSRHFNPSVSEMGALGTSVFCTQIGLVSSHKRWMNSRCERSWCGQLRISVHGCRDQHHCARWNSSLRSACQTISVYSS